MERAKVIVHMYVSIDGKIDGLDLVMFQVHIIQTSFFG